MCIWTIITMTKVLKRAWMGGRRYTVNKTVATRFLLDHVGSELKELIQRIRNDVPEMRRIVDNRINPMLKLIENSRAFARFVSLKFADQTFNVFPELVDKIEALAEELRNSMETGQDPSAAIIALYNFFSNDSVFGCYRSYASSFVQARTNLDQLYFDEDFFQSREGNYRRSIDLRRKAIQKMTVQGIIEMYLYPLTFLDSLCLSLKRISKHTPWEHPDVSLVRKTARLARLLHKNVHKSCDHYGRY